MTSYKVEQPARLLLPLKSPSQGVVPSFLTPFILYHIKKPYKNHKTMSSNTNGREAGSQRKPLGMLTQSVITALLGERENNFVPMLLFYGEGEIAGDL